MDRRYAIKKLYWKIRKLKIIKIENISIEVSDVMLPNRWKRFLNCCSHSNEDPSFTSKDVSFPKNKNINCVLS